MVATSNAGYATLSDRSALLAVEQLAQQLGRRRPRLATNPLFVHGKPAGLTPLVSLLVAACPAFPVTVVSADRFTRLLRRERIGIDLVRLMGCRLVIIKNLHRLKPGHSEQMVQFIDGCLRGGRQMVFTSRVGPGELTMPQRLVSRMAAGLVVSLQHS